MGSNIQFVFELGAWSNEIILNFYVFGLVELSRFSYSSVNEIFRHQRLWDATGDFLDILPNEINLSFIWPKICDIKPCHERLTTFLSLRNCNKAWKKLAANSDEYAFVILVHCEVQLERQFLEKETRNSKCGIMDQNEVDFYLIPKWNRHFNITWHWFVGLEIVVRDFFYFFILYLGIEM